MIEISMRQLILAGDALVVQLDCPPPSAPDARKEAIKALKKWQQLADAAKRELGID